MLARLYIQFSDSENSAMGGRKPSVKELDTFPGRNE